MSLLCSAPILSRQEIVPGHFLLTFRAPAMAKVAQPGQFVHVRCGDTLDPLLRRPLSLHGIDRSKGTLTLLYRLVGKGTARLSRMRLGEAMDVMGPLGRGFSLSLPSGRVVNEAVVVGGGIGVAPLLPLIEALLNQGSRVTVLLGARSADGLLRLKAFEQTGARVEIATDDGSLGVKGNVADLLTTRGTVLPVGSSCVYACGPVPMLRTIWQMCAAQQVPLQVSLEERMGCGVGACLACVCRVTRTDEGKNKEISDDNYVKSSFVQATELDWKYARVCVEGPVFWGEEVLLDE